MSGTHCSPQNSRLDHLKEGGVANIGCNFVTGLVPRACRMSAKLFNCTPAQLPADLKANLVTMLQCGVNALEGYIRPGCVHLVRLNTLKP